MEETQHDYQGCLMGNFYSTEPSGNYDSWKKFKNTWLGFANNDDGFTKYDDTYHFLFRYDVHKYEDNYILELCFMLQRKGIYSHIYVDVTQDDLNLEIPKWLEGRKKYLEKLWAEVG
ncbi:MAG: hypothetical protein KIC96_07720 [Enterococcus casseliflavus]|nr:hypothetical protein [Enterococcus casseliflavus]MDU3374123.1 hypothetical protein [Enterococcus casseliflavus]